MPRITRQLLQQLRGNGLGRVGEYAPDDANVGAGGQGYDEGQVWGNVPQGNDAAQLYAVDSQSIGMVQNSPGDAPGFDAIVWSSFTYAGQQQIKLPADKNRVVLIVENISTVVKDVPISVNFGQNATTEGAGPSGLQLLRNGSVLYIDTYCPTNDVYIELPAVNPTPQFAACSIVLGTRGQPKSWQSALAVGGYGVAR